MKKLLAQLLVLSLSMQAFAVDNTYFYENGIPTEIPSVTLKMAPGSDTGTSTGALSMSVLMEDEKYEFNQKIPKPKVFEQYRQDVIDFGTNYLGGEFEKVRPNLREGPGVSGGGNSVVCFDSAKIPAEIRNKKSTRFGQIGDDELRNHVVSIVTYDLHFAMMPRGLDRVTPKLIQPRANETGRQYLERIARRFDNYLPTISAMIRQGSMAFKDSNITFAKNGLDRIHDENDVSYIDPSNCVVATMAAQYRMGEESFLTIDDRLFSHPKHSRMSQYVLLLHEAIYQSVRTFTKQADSHSTRMLVSAILREEPLSFDEMEGLYNDLKLPAWASIKNAATALYNARSSNVLWSMNERLEEIVASAEHQQMLKKYNELVKKYSAGPEVFYYAGHINMHMVRCPRARYEQCYKDFSKFEYQLVPYLDLVSVELLKRFWASLKHEILLPLAAIPGADESRISSLLFTLQGVLNLDHELSRNVTGGGRKRLFLYLEMSNPSVQYALENLRISEVIP